MNLLSYQWSDSPSPLMTGVPRQKIAFRRVIPDGLKKTVTSSLWIGAVALLTTQSISRIPLPTDGQVVEIPASSLSHQPKLNSQSIFWINGVVSSAEEKVVSKIISEDLTPQISEPVNMIRNGSLCQDEEGNCSKEFDYIKAFFNRFGNQLTGRGNEPIIEATKNVLRKNLTPELPHLQLITYSEGGLIAHAAISELNREDNLNLKKITVIFLGTPLHHDKIAELEAIVGKVVVLNNPHDPVTCLQHDVFNWSSWLGTDAKVKQCLMNSQIQQHTIKLYMGKLLSTLGKN